MHILTPEAFAQLPPATPRPLPVDLCDRPVDPVVFVDIALDQWADAATLYFLLRNEDREVESWVKDAPRFPITRYTLVSKEADGYLPSYQLTISGRSGNLCRLATVPVGVWQSKILRVTQSEVGPCLTKP